MTPEPPELAVVSEGPSGNLRLGTGLGLAVYALLALGLVLVPATPSERANLVAAAVLFVPITAAVFAWGLALLDKPGLPRPVRWTARTLSYALIAPMMLLVLATPKGRRRD